MNKKILLLPVIGLFLYAALAGNASGPGGTSALECTGASGSTTGCGGTTCHGSAATLSTALSIQLLSGSTPVTQYVGGSSYTLRIQATNTGAIMLPRFGFQLGVVRTSTTTNAGTMTAIAGTHLLTVSGINLVEHNPSSLPPTTGSGGGGSTYVVDIPWVSPATGTGSVSVYAAVNLTNNDGFATASDKWRTAVVNFPELSSGLGPITGTPSVCVGATTTLSNSTPGGTWSVQVASVASVGLTTGIVTGLIPATTIISYTTPSSGYQTLAFTVNPTPASLTGSTSGCAGSSFTLSTTSSGGSWSSSNPSVATVSTSGLVTGVSGGTAIISYSYATGCKTTRQVTIDPLPSAGTISGSPTVCVTTTTPLTSTVTGGSWSSSDITKATVNSTTGIVTGVATGTVNITYTNTNACGSATAVKALTVQPASACTSHSSNTAPTPVAGLSAYPNPSKGTFAVYLSSAKNEETTIEVINSVGAVIMRQPITTNTSTDIHLHTAGIYTIRTRVADAMYVQKILVTN